MTEKQPLTNEKAIEYFTELQRLISVGAYSERSAEHYETDTWPEDGVEESVHNLEEWAASKGLDFCWHNESKVYTLEPIVPSIANINTSAGDPDIDAWLARGDERERDETGTHPPDCRCGWCEPA